MTVVLSQTQSAGSLCFDTFSQELGVMGSQPQEQGDKAMDKATKNNEKEDASKDCSDRDRVTFDDILSELGEFGLEQKLNYFMWSLPCIISAMQLIDRAFVRGNMPHRCRLPEEVGLDNVSFSYNNNTMWESQSYSRSLDNVTTACEDGWVYDRSQVEDSVVSDWDLVCT